MITDTVPDRQLGYWEIANEKGVKPKIKNNEIIAIKGGMLLKRIALVQNQSEMANYSHADCRSILTKLGYSFELFTANSIATIDDKIALGQFDCLMLASNALHDKVIRQFFESDLGKTSVRDFQRAGGGVVVLMQYKAAYDGYSFDFVVPEAEHPSASQRPRTESAVNSKIVAIERPSSPPLLTYPNSVALDKLEEASIAHPTLPGVYWHWWNANIASAWNLHLACGVAGDERPLIITAQEHFGIRAVMCSLPVDWHSHSDLLDNILLYGCEGRHYAAAITETDAPEASLQYLVAKLRARKVGLREYVAHSDGILGIFENIKKGVHNTLLLEPNVDLENIFNVDQVDFLNDKVERGEIRTVTFEPNSKACKTSVQIRGRRNPAEDAYQVLIPRISQELLGGFLDGSFRSTVSGLQDMEYLPYGLDFGIFPARTALEEAEKHERDGSYDEVIGASAGFLWLRARVLGADDPKVMVTLDWLRARIAKVDAREKINTLCTLEDCGLAIEDDREAVKVTLGSLSAIGCSELELLAYLTGAVKFSDEKTALSVLSDFSRRSKMGGGPIWVDTPTTASLVRLLVEAHERFPSLRSKESRSGEVLRELLIPSMIYIEAEYERSLSRTRDDGYPWDGKASTALRCLSAWYRFEQYLRAPVEEAASAIARASQEATLNTLADGAVGSLHKLFAEYDGLKTGLAEKNAEISKILSLERDLNEKEEKVNKAARSATIALMSSFVMAYFILDHYVRKYAFGEKLSDVGDSIIKNYGQHTAVLLAVFAAFAVPWRAVLHWFGGFVGGGGTTWKGEE